MGSAKHTPGPWFAEGYDIWGPLDSRSRHRNGRVLIGGVVDSVQDWRGMRWAEGETKTLEAETRANSRLFAAAPQLLDACEAAVDLYERGYPESDYAADVMEGIRDAIAAAKGEVER